MATYRSAWDNIRNSPHAARTGSADIVQLGKSLWNLFGKKLARDVHNYFSPEANLSREDRISRRVWYETVYDVLAPDNQDTTLYQTIVDAKTAKNSVFPNQQTPTNITTPAQTAPMDELIFTAKT